MPRILTQFRQTYPRIEIHMKSGFSHDRYRDFLEGKYHVCIVRGGHNWNEEKRLLWQDPLCAFSRDPLNMDLLPSYPYIHYITDPMLQNVLDEWWYAHYRKPPFTIIETDAMDTCLKMVQEGLGFTLLSRSCGQDTPQVHPTVLTTVEGQPLMRETWMYYRKNYHLLASVRAFVDFMKEKY
jgi:DNA-binding transcriptional LysR family regulator